MNRLIARALSSALPLCRLQHRSGETSPSPDGYFLTTLKCYLSNPRWLLMYTFGRFAPLRALVIGLVRWTRSPASDPGLSPTLFPHVDPDETLTAMRRDGFFAPLVLPDEAVQEICAFANTHACYPDRERAFAFYHGDRLDAEKNYGQPILLARYFNTAAECAAIERLQGDPLLRQIASRYIGAPAKHIGNRLWWSFAREATPVQRVRSGQGYHWDLDDYRMVTFFFYLTDVDAAAGPHALVRGSHRRKPLRWLCSLFKARPDAEVLAHYGPENEVVLSGPAGFGFSEDLLCFHKGNAPATKDRLLLQIRFGLFDYSRASDLDEGLSPALFSPLRATESAASGGH